MKTLQGIGVSEGFAIGQAVWLEETEQQDCPETIAAGAEQEELERFEAACAAVKAELDKQIETMTEKLGAKQAEIFTAHRMMLEDPTLVDAVTEMINNRQSAVFAVHKVTAEMAAMFAAMDNDYMRERAADITDIGRRLTRKLQGRDNDGAAAVSNGIVVAQDLLPSDTALLDKDKVLGFVTALGGKTSHTSILARAAGLPAVVGLGGQLDEISPRATIILDGGAGLVLVDPDAATVAKYEKKLEDYQRWRKLLAAVKELPSQTADGRVVEIAANIGTPQEIAKVQNVNADGIGLFRTEFVFMGRTELPTEEEQFEAYKQVLEGLPNKKVIFRTLDAGGDKELDYLGLPPEANPALGLRAVRLCFSRTDIFKTQLRALLRASVYGNLHIMFPMISGLEEFRQAKSMLNQAREELTRQGIACKQKVPVGIMVEIPAAAVMADVLAQEVDFFSIGTNDLVQYTVAVDRMNEQVAYLSDYFHPAVLRLISRVIEASHNAGKWTGMCGEMAGDPLATVLLTGFGLDEFSMHAGAVLEVKNLIRRIKTDEAQAYAKEAMKLGTSAEIRAYLQQIKQKYTVSED
ncbi:phosphoenolpyruvate--protein phosphotransferase [Lucifera butyrica]|nr:phosphoenolpyruvate--protein phosphotransferase [Lucifera butyrica]